MNVKGKSERWTGLVASDTSDSEVEGIMRIGELAAATGVSTRALRYYEEQELLTSERSKSGQRHYAADAVERVRWIQALYAAGLSSRVIVGLLPCVHTGVATPDMVARLVVERERVAAQIDGLSETRDRLDQIITAARGSAPVGAA